MTFDAKLQRKILGQFATGVTIITMPIKGGYWGMTANSIASLSLAPPLVMVSVGKDNQTHSLLKEAKCFAMNILSERQQEISDRFAQEGPKDFSDLSFTTGETGSPILDGILGYVDCRITEILPAGDHEIFVGRIVTGDVRGGRPLIYFGGGYRHLSE